MGDRRVGRARGRFDPVRPRAHRARAPPCSARSSTRRSSSRPGARIGVDRAEDLARGFIVTDSGITVVGKGVPRTGHRVTPHGPGRARGPLVVLDADSTLIREEAIELLADAAGSLEHVAEVTERAMRGELDFAESLRERVATLAGLDVEVLAQARDAHDAHRRRARAHRRRARGRRPRRRRVRRIPRAARPARRAPRTRLLPREPARGRRRPAHRAGRRRRSSTPPRRRRRSTSGRRPAASRSLADRRRGRRRQRPARCSTGRALGVAFCAKPVVREQADVAIDTPDLSAVLAAARPARLTARAAHPRPAGSFLPNPDRIADTDVRMTAMSGRIVARTFVRCRTDGALLAVSGAHAAVAAPQAPPGQLEDRSTCPNGFQPEGIAIDPRGTAYVGSLADGDVYAFDCAHRRGDRRSSGGSGHAVGRA